MLGDDSISIPRPNPVGTCSQSSPACRFPAETGGEQASRGFGKADWQYLVASLRQAAAPREETVVFKAGLAISERSTGQRLDPAAGRFENGLAGRGVPLHRRAKARVEVGLPGGDDAEFERAAATFALAYRIVGKKLG